jgi:hypothetical protein
MKTPIQHNSNDEVAQEREKTQLAWSKAALQAEIPRQRVVLTSPADGVPASAENYGRHREQLERLVNMEITFTKKDDL